MPLYAGMMELVVMLDSKSSGFTRVGSSPTTGTNMILISVRITNSILILF